MATVNGLTGLAGTLNLGQIIKPINGIGSPVGPKVGEIWPRGSKNTAS